MSTSSKCPSCSSGDVTRVLALERVPVFCNQLCRSREQALAAPTAAMDLFFCSSCGHLYNAGFDPAKVEYSPEYENSLHFSGQFQRFADTLTQEIVGRYDLAGGTVVEIGCGRGDFLRGVCRVSRSRGVGFDPSYPADEADPDEHVQITRGLLDTSKAPDDPSLLICRHCLEHIDEPVAFLRQLRNAVAKSKTVPVYFEVPNVLFTLRDGGIWDLIYEHCGYFSPASMRRAFVEAGFEVDEISETFHGQFLSLYGQALAAGSDTPPGGATSDATSADEIAKLQAQVRSFSELYRRKVGDYTDRLTRATAGGRRVVAWGAGSKGTTFLNVVSAGVEAIVDINARKQGMFVAGSGQPIVAPEALREIRPDVVVVMNPAYADEIRGQLTELSLSPEIWTA